LYHHNPNYGVLARIVEVTSGERFSDYLYTDLFAPLNMRHTVNVITSAETARVADTTL
jgi:CubicO group peptidase (beta-lactamase class C family)